MYPNWDLPACSEASAADAQRRRDNKRRLPATHEQEHHAECEAEEERASEVRVVHHVRIPRVVGRVRVDGVEHREALFDNVRKVDAELCVR